MTQSPKPLDVIGAEAPLAGAISEEAIKHLKIRSPLNRAIYGAVRNYRMSNMCDEDDHTAPYPLVDLMSNPAPADIGSGEMEMVALADEIEAAVAAFTEQSATAETVGGGVLRALELALPIVEADYEQAKEMCDADWEGQSFTALEAIRTALDRSIAVDPSKVWRDAYVAVYGCEPSHPKADYQAAYDVIAAALSAPEDTPEDHGACTTCGRGVAHFTHHPFGDEHHDFVSATAVERATVLEAIERNWNSGPDALADAILALIEGSPA